MLEKDKYQEANSIDDNDAALLYLKRLPQVAQLCQICIFILEY
jgi:hypothetical protein